MPVSAISDQSLEYHHEAGASLNLQLPDLPTMVLSEPTCTLAAPLIAPCTTITRAPAEFAAAESCGSVLTVVVTPPAPPLVLNTALSTFGIAK